MKRLILLQILAFFGFTQQLLAQCGPTDVFVDPLPAAICGGDMTTLNLTANGNCTGNYEFQIMAGANVVQPWGTLATFDASPTTTTLYTVNVRCDACPATVVSDTFSVHVTETPVISGDTLVCSGTGTVLTATSNAQTIEWWDAQSGGNQLSATGTYTTPALTSDQTYWVHASNTGIGGGGGSILITECGLEGFFGGGNSEDYLEVTNLYTTPVNTAGWVCAISDSYSNINAVNNTLWNLPSSFPPCDIQYRTDAAGNQYPWGSNMFWNGTSPGWAIIVDDAGNVVDFCAWGWTVAQLSSFNTTINGFNVTLGAEWVGNSCPQPCSTGQWAWSRVGNADSNTNADFVCQASSLLAVNPGLSCGWTVNTACTYPVNVVVDQPPTASNPATVNVECVGDVPAVDVTVVNDEADDFTAAPTVTFVSEVSDGLSCPETITRTYRVADSCSNYIDVTHTITVHDVTAPVLDPAPADVTVECSADIPAIVSLGWTDNCDGSGTVAGSEVSDGQSCPETITRTWTYTDACGNTATETQIITVHDITAPVIDPAPAGVTVECSADIPAMVSLGWTDNCDGSGTLSGVEVSDGQSCPETITRTWTYTDACGNTATETQVIIVHDITAPTASNLPTVQVVTLPAPNPLLITDAADNCTASPVVAWVSDISDGGFCPEIVQRTYSVTDDCGNVTFVTQDFTVGDPIPEASFIATPQELSNLDTYVEFYNTTQGGVTYVWNFDDGTPVSNEVNPTHTFPDEESAGYVVELIAYSEFGCSDTFTVVVSVEEELLYYIPNTFTPDFDEYNQEFKPVFTSGFDIYDWHMIIFNRWGEIIFESFDASAGWDGTFGGEEGKDVPSGTYVWKIEFKTEASDERKMISGHVNVLR